MDNKNTFTWNGFTYYRTRTGKYKKYDRDKKRYDVSVEEYTEMANKYYNVMR